MKFSEHYGYTPVRESIQFESIDEALRNRLWSLLHIYCWDKAEMDSGDGMYSPGVYFSRDSNKAHYVLACQLWINYFKLPVDKLGYRLEPLIKKVREQFFNGPWHEP